MAKNKTNKDQKNKLENLKYLIRDAKLNFNEKIEDNDKIMAIDEEAPFIVLVKKPNNMCWVVDFLLGERIQDYNSIPKIKVSDYFKVIRSL